MDEDKSSHVLKFGIWWRSVVNFILQLIYPGGIRPKYSLDRTLGGPEPFWAW
jgi:hypothetical protein